jgi:hypothetical protein
LKEENGKVAQKPVKLAVLALIEIKTAFSWNN